ncbi:helix-turn-helix domain-containing protein [Candidatus Neptunochlamydia vexilliferae]|uniref:HTH cro/C1-type domain-containing protein n=1 Tax=Candidatus Neptunichlamydia vexilliferae TaxID=1651774 RepID=A0ABS0AX45_9BACT|nr:helix-turn-helix transcriptional regulator [Candidatus Neptunochlamydia vexilliferae]MBF5058707.1 hypothetical protein [Candidatus Neptunochlamydia vexilliferae]
MKDYLFKNNLSVKQVAGDLDISTSYLYQLIRRERKPSIELAQRIEEYTQGDVTVGKLLGFEGDEITPLLVESSMEKYSKECRERLTRLEDEQSNFKEKLDAIETRLSRLESEITP